MTWIKGPKWEPWPIPRSPYEPRPIPKQPIPPPRYIPVPIKEEAMPDQNYCDITLVLDRSGSMESIKDSMEEAIAGFISEQKKLPGKCTLSVLEFDTRFNWTYTGCDIKGCDGVKINPGGSTALWDAVGKAINETGSRLRAMYPGNRPGKVVFVVVTDGHENASKEFTSAQVRDKLVHQQEGYNWHFVYMGANQDAWSAAHAMGVPQANYMNYAPNDKGVKHVYGAMASNVSALRSGNKADLSFDDNQVQADATWK